MTQVTGELPSGEHGASWRHVLANRCPGLVSGPGLAEAADTPLTLQPCHYHPTPDTMPGYCGDTTLGLCSSLVNETDGYKEAKRKKKTMTEDKRAIDIWNKCQTQHVASFFV